MIDQVAYWIGLWVLFVGGGLLALIIAAMLAWSAFEVISKRVGWTQQIWEWKRDRRRSQMGG